VLFSIRGGLPFIALAAVVVRYMTMDTQGIAHGWAMDSFPSAWAFWGRYGLFCLLEFGILGLVLLRLRAFDLKVGVGVLVLLALPFYQFGPGNDLVMRSSIPALAVLALAAVRPLGAALGRPLARGLLALVLMVGVIGSAQEVERGLLMPRWALTGKTLAQVAADESPFHVAVLPLNYVGRLSQPGLMTLMREPAPVRPSAAR
jgi:hypothetical protein